MADIVERARKYWGEMTEMDGGECGEMAMFRELADTVESLRATNARLSEALRRFVRIRDWNHDEAHVARREYDNAADEARTALSSTGTGKG